MSDQDIDQDSGARRIGLIAGGGDFPLLVARAAHRRGLEVVCAGIRLEVSPDLAAEVDVFRQIRLLSLGKFIRFFRRHDVRHLTWAGGIGKDRLLSWRGVLHHLPDLYALRFWFGRLRRLCYFHGGRLSRDDRRRYGDGAQLLG